MTIVETRTEKKARLRTQRKIERLCPDVKRLRLHRIFLSPPTTKESHGR